MKLFLLRHYWKPDFDITQNRSLLVIGMMMPVVIMMAWAFPEAGGIWIATSLTAILGAVTPQRPSLFEAALPISGRDIAVVRLLTSFAVTATPIIVAAAVVMTSHHVPLPLFEIGSSLAIAALGVLVPRLVRANEFAVAPASTLTPLFVVGAAAAAAIMSLSHTLSLGLLIAGGTIAAAWWWIRVPHAFQIASLSASSGGRDASVASVSDAASDVQLWRVISSVVLTKNRLFGSVMMIMGGAVGNWPLFVFSLFSFEDLWQRARWMQPLPISHRVRLWVLIVPGVLMPLCFAIIGMQIHWPGSDWFQGVHRGAIDTYKQEPRYFDSETSVSLDYWEKATVDVPVITAPWGETVQPYMVHVFNRTYYNPYTARKSSSERFTNWQYERLTTAFFGKPLDLKQHDHGQTNPRRLNASLRMMILNIATALVFAFVYMLCAGLMRWHKAWSQQPIAQAIMLLAMFIPMGVWLYSIMVYGFQQGAMNVVIPLLERQLMNLSAVLPSSNFVVLAIAALPVLLIYAMLEWQFKRSEVIGPQPKL